ncbi:hypothetical protein [uncultured Methylobacterium sp.]|jgi:hypothetical protein|uniref:hypothetical protein n=1 Tax=uncultured Methylobacterium sp. TaxID=157278 RepID=UPI00261DBE7B|nr:hypothetical protein [uncultured Methylobacterium sp.]
MKALLIVLWTLAAGIVLFLIVRGRITRMTRDLAAGTSSAPGSSGPGSSCDDRRDPQAPPDPPQAA